MLVLTRKQQENICIGDEIVITVLRVKGKSVRLGIEAPDKVCVLRGELVFDASANKLKAANPENTTDTDRKPVLETARKGVKRGTRQADTTHPGQRVALPRTNVCHFQVPREGSAQATASL
jgi:carbon storage regulator